MPTAVIHWSCSRCVFHIHTDTTYMYVQQCVYSLVHNWMFLLHSGSDLGFLELGRTTNVGRLNFSHDGVSSKIPIDIGYAFGNTSQQSVYVSNLELPHSFLVQFNWCFNNTDWD